MHWMFPWHSSSVPFLDTKKKNQENVSDDDPPSELQLTSTKLETLSARMLEERFESGWTKTFHATNTEWKAVFFEKHLSSD